MQRCSVCGESFYRLSKQGHELWCNQCLSGLERFKVEWGKQQIARIRSFQFARSEVLGCTGKIDEIKGNMATLADMPFECSTDDLISGKLFFSYTVSESKRL